jgi:hypothetical protein
MFIAWIISIAQYYYTGRTQSFFSLVHKSLNNQWFTWHPSHFLFLLNSLSFLLLVSYFRSRTSTFFRIPLILIAPLRSVLAMNRGLFHVTVPSLSARSRSHSSAASPLLHFAPFPTAKSSLGSPGRFLLTRLTVGWTFTVLKPSFFLVLLSVSALSSFSDKEVNGGVCGLIGRVVTSTCNQ